MKILLFNFFKSSRKIKIRIWIRFPHQYKNVKDPKHWNHVSVMIMVNGFSEDNDHCILKERITMMQVEENTQQGESEDQEEQIYYLII